MQTRTKSQPAYPSPLVRHVVRPMTRVLNPAIRRLAGRRHPALARLEHRGRRSGREYVTPVSAHLTGDTFLVPLTFGDRSDWCRNVLEAGGCSIRWRGRDQVTRQRVAALRCNGAGGGLLWASLRRAYHHGGDNGNLLDCARMIDVSGAGEWVRGNRSIGRSPASTVISMLRCILAAPRRADRVR